MENREQTSCFDKQIEYFREWEVRKIENIDKAIDVICDWIQKELKSEGTTERNTVVEMITALTELLKTKMGLQAIKINLKPKAISTELLMQDIKEKLEESIQDCCY